MKFSFYYTDIIIFKTYVVQTVFCFVYQVQHLVCNGKSENAISNACLYFTGKFILGILLYQATIQILYSLNMY